MEHKRESSVFNLVSPSSAEFRYDVRVSSIDVKFMLSFVSVTNVNVNESSFWHMSIAISSNEISVKDSTLNKISFATGLHKSGKI